MGQQSKYSSLEEQANAAEASEMPPSAPVTTPEAKPAEEQPKVGE